MGCHCLLRAGWGRFRNSENITACDVVCNRVTEGQKNIEDGITFPNGFTRTLLLDDRPVDPGLHGYAVF